MLFLQTKYCKRIPFLILFVSIFVFVQTMISCNNEPTSDYERIAIKEVKEYNVREDSTIKLNMRRDSAYVINSLDEWKRSGLETFDTAGLHKNFNPEANTIIALVSIFDYNIIESEIYLYRNKVNGRFSLTLNYKLGEPQMLDYIYYRVTICLLPEKTYAPKGISVGYGIT